MRAEDIATLEVCEHLGVAPAAARNSPLYHRFLRVLREAQNRDGGASLEEKLAQRDAEWSAALWMAGLKIFPLTPDVQCVREAIDSFESQVIQDMREPNGSRQAPPHS